MIVKRLGMIALIVCLLTVTFNASAKQNANAKKPHAENRQPSKVKNLKASLTNSGVNLNWQAVIGSDGYLLYREQGQGGNVQKTIIELPGNLNSFRDEPLETGLRYRYRISAIQGDKLGGKSGTATIHVPAGRFNEIASDVAK